MSESRWLLRAAFAVTASTTVLAGCSSNSSTPEPAVTVTETAAASPAPASPAATTEATTSAAKAPTAPSGATVKESKEEGGMQYTRYSITGTSAEDVVNDYESQFKEMGYTITNAGGSGGGWGQWGGSGYGMDASSDGSFASVQAGGSDNGPTYFEVCLGPDKSVVDQCGQQSQDDQNDSNSKGS